MKLICWLIDLFCTPRWDVVIDIRATAFHVIAYDGSETRLYTERLAD